MLTVLFCIWAALVAAHLLYPLLCRMGWLSTHNLTVEFLDVDEGGHMLKKLDLDNDGTKRIRLVGRTKSGKAHPLENVTVLLSDDEVGTAVLVADAIEPSVVIISGKGITRSASLLIEADGRLGEGVKHITAELEVNFHDPDAASIDFEELEDTPVPMADSAGE